jgi:hypothetical protein
VVLGGQPDVHLAAMPEDVAAAKEAMIGQLEGVLTLCAGLRLPVLLVLPRSPSFGSA